LAASPASAGLALRAAASVGAHYAGVDLLSDVKGRVLVLEVNSMPAWRGLQTVTTFPIADHIAAALLRGIG
jgi:tetrahydromethanopterin:alpha-L-glutamate ligase